MGVTKLQFSTLEELFDFYNKNLFDNKLPSWSRVGKIAMPICKHYFFLQMGVAFGICFGISSLNEDAL